jgi:hypothetical protein
MSGFRLGFASLLSHRSMVVVEGQIGFFVGGVVCLRLWWFFKVSCGGEVLSELRWCGGGGYVSDPVAFGGGVKVVMRDGGRDVRCWPGDDELVLTSGLWQRAWRRRISCMWWLDEVFVGF